LLAKLWALMPCKISMHLVILYFLISKGELVARLLKRRTRTSIRDHKSDSLFLHNNITPSCIEFEMTAKALLLLWTKGVNHILR
jgi:hypothetical protein